MKSVQLIGGILIGLVTMFFFYPEVMPPDQEALPIDYAKVESVSGLMIFIESEPINKQKFETIAVIDNAILEESIKSLFDKDKTWLQKTIGGIKSLSYSEKLRGKVEIVNKSYPTATAIILRDGFNECEVLK